MWSSKINRNVNKKVENPHTLFRIQSQQTSIGDKKNAVPWRLIYDNHQNYSRTSRCMVPACLGILFTKRAISVSRSGEKHASLEAKQFQKMTRFVVFTAAARGRECSSLFVVCQELLVVHICISHVLHVSINAYLMLIYSEVNMTEFGAPLMLLRHTQDEKKN